MTWTSQRYRDLRFRERMSSLLALIGAIVATLFAVVGNIGGLAIVSGAFGYLSGAAWQIASYWDLRAGMAEFEEANR